MQFEVVMDFEGLPDSSNQSQSIELKPAIKRIVESKHMFHIPRHSERIIRDLWGHALT